MTPAEEPKDTKTIEDAAGATEESGQNNSFLGIIFVVVGRSCIEGHCITNQIESIYKEMELLLVKVGA